MSDNDDQILYDQAADLYEQEKLPEARELLERILVRSPYEHPAIILLAAVLFKMKEFLFAEELAIIGLSMCPDDALAQDVMKLVAQERAENRNAVYYNHYMINRARFMHYPQSVSIETTGRCNAACSFCPHPDLDRNKGSMSDVMFEKIITDLEAIPKDHKFTISPGGINEPFMDKKFFTRLRMINERLPQAGLIFFTNLNVMHRDFAEEIIKIQNIEYFNVSFNAANPEEYESVMKIKFDRTVKNLKSLMTLNRQSKFMKLPVILSRVGDLTDADDRYGPEVQALFSDFTEHEDYTFKVKRRTNWINKLDISTHDVPTYQPCTAWFDLFIHSNGQIPHCCMDSDATYAIGHVMEKSVLEIYNGANFKYLRETIPWRGAAGSPCNKCALV